MEASGTNADALNQRIDKLCDELMKGFLRILACASEDSDTTFSSTAQNELSMVDHVHAFKRSVEELSSLIRDLQQLWLFGSLDTLTDPGDEAAKRARTLKIAADIEELAKNLPSTVGGDVPPEKAESQDGER
ncbi:hypothetical protein BU24DRAFT_461540 [Aaosphaeria arxii CBS 175.79]|uniref:Mediator of RNA polymerase II transcription subunit 22 n=1 Tax=Aaosphaeria arxii CBS 175.79 TaxID=1450172 RepID=A0A6A5XPW4_9PLEO|nr:uncharacterized protein BU24DRAFT_461540 [Aaosphaeria arxii CBS 175.79]KAF2015288.1 hypothetical protein BU24DRAFT_461540 [Aaosphaeria arxii CBS 175.79]